MDAPGHDCVRQVQFSFYGNILLAKCSKIFEKYFKKSNNIKLTGLKPEWWIKQRGDS